MKPWLVAFAACSAPAPAPVIHNATSGQPTLVLRMERSECLGSCPEYVVEVMNNGSVKWHGIANVNLLGDTIAHVSEADVQRMVAAFTKAGFFELVGVPEKFRVDCSSGKCLTIICSILDAPTTRVTIVRDHEPHTYEAPACESPLDRAEELVDTIIGAKVWIGVRAD